MVAFPIDSESNFSAGSPDVLFEASDFLGSGGGRAFDISPDGQKFLMVKQGGPTDSTAESQIILVQNWVEELTRLVPVP